MFFRIFAIFALLAVAFADPKPEPKPQYVAGLGVPYAYPGYAPLAYSAPYAAGAYPYGYYGYVR